MGFLVPKSPLAKATATASNYRTIANMVAVMIREHCARVGLAIQDKQASPIA